MKNHSLGSDEGTPPSKSWNLLHGAFFLTAAGLLSGLGNYLFQGIIGRQLNREEYGLVNTTLSFAGFLSLPLATATFAVTHYIARFNFSGDDERLHELLTGCRRFLRNLTFVGTFIAVILVIPLSNFFHFPRVGLMVVVLLCVVAGLWSAFATAFCQGLAWFGRLAIIGLLAVLLRILYGWLATMIWPVAEAAASASAVMLLAYVLVLVWRKDFPRRTEKIVSPWTREFGQFLMVSAAYVFGTYCFVQSDLLVAQRNFGGTSVGAYSAAGLLARALPMVLTPLLTVLFTHRSGQRHGDALREQLKLIGLYAVGLIGGAIVLFVLRDFCVRLIFGKPAPEAAAMILRFATTMVFVGLLQALSTWSLASRWPKILILYFVLGGIYWMALLIYGKSSADLLQAMPIVAGIAFGVLFLIWLIALRTHKIGEPAQT